ncbi:MAG: methanogenesis marker protein Mmp4/MtxX [Candidatus Helarchaeota archaeon]
MILETVKTLARKNKTKIGIGVIPDKINLMNELKQIVEENQFASLVFFNDSPDLIQSLQDGEVDGIVRGNLPSNTFLKEIKKAFDLDTCYRLALLESSNNQEFFFAPVGIDEARDVKEKKTFITLGIKLMKELGMSPKIGILSGGRTDDIGRDPSVDKSIEEANKILQWMEREYANIGKNYNILIENAINEKVNMILAPNGMSGNLIYRTLIHLGSGKSHGAPYLNVDKPVIDTSRVAPLNEYISAVSFASALKNKS